MTDHSRIRKMAKRGISTAEIARNFGVSRQAVHQVLQKHGEVVNPRRSDSACAPISIRLLPNEHTQIEDLQKHWKTRNRAETIRRALEVCAALLRKAS